MTRRRSWTENQLRNAVKNSTSYRQVLIKLGLREAGGNYKQINKYIKEYGLDINHFKGHAWNKGMRGLSFPRVPLERILVKSSHFRSSKLKDRLFTLNLKPKYCEQCGWAERATGGYLPLELDHINGNKYDNRLENLKILCPNCHSLTPSYRGRKRYKING